MVMIYDSRWFAFVSFFSIFSFFFSFCFFVSSSCTKSENILVY